MAVYLVDFDCYWDGGFPVEHTTGSFSLDLLSDLEVIYYIKKNFLNHVSLLDYHFIISSNENVFEIKKGV